MRIAGFFLIIFLTGEAGAGCFREHLREAVALNRSRAEAYARLSGGASRVISRKLIASEERLILASYFVNIDLLAFPYERAGIGVTCESYLPMNKTPAFRTRFRKGPPPASRIQNLHSIRVGSRLRRAFSSGDDRLLLEVSLRILRELSGEKRVHCMTRHVVESVARLASLIGLHEKKASAAGLPSPRLLHRKMIYGHLASLGLSHELDLLALPLQRKGLPILCQDVPPIPHPDGG